MSVINFIQTIWSKRIQDDLKRKCILVGNCTTEYEGDCKYARTVRILAAGDPTISNYTGGKINYEEMSDASQDLNIDIQKSFSFLVHDVDMAQAVPGLKNKFQEKAVDGLAKTRDDLVGKLVAGVAQNTAQQKDAEDNAETQGYTPTYLPGATNIITATAKTQAAVKAAIDDAIVALRERDMYGDGVIEMSPRVYNIFKNNLIELNTNNPELIKRGAVGMYDTFECFQSNGIYRDNSHDWCIVRSKNAIAFAGQINEVEAGRHPDYFADYIRGLDTYGMKIIAQKELEVVKIPV